MKIQKLLFCTGLLAWAGLSQAAEQTITFDPAAITAGIGTEGVSITASYEASDAAKTSGVGISLYFDSSKLTFVSLAGNADLEDFLISSTATPDSIQDDSGNADEDETTDKKAIIAFASFNGKFPAIGEVFTVVFNVNNDIAVGSTSVNTTLALAAGYDGVAAPVVVTIVADTDNDGQTDDIDNDDDNDGVLDEADAFPLDETESIDTDGDQIGNNTDTDDDGDGVLDEADAFPLDGTESIDTDGDDIGNNTDTDDDGDDVADASDAFPLDETESIDTDGDQIGNNTDTDDDGDGILDENDLYPLERDLELPTITAPTVIIVEAAGSEGLASTSELLAAYLAGATAIDNIDGDVSAQATNDAPDVFPLGTTEVVFTIVDSSNNTAAASSTVTVSDTVGPVITVASELRISLAEAATLTDSDSRIAEYITSATALDVVTGAADVVTESPESYAIGTATVTFRAVDATGNTTEVNGSIIISIGPQVIAPDAISVVAIDGVSVAASLPQIASFLADTSAVATDGTELAVTNDAPETLEVGVNTIVFSATDAEDQVGTASTSITVLVASASADTDLDGMDDLFEVTNSLDPNAADGELDSDGDGLTNLEEYVQGLDPTTDDVGPVVVVAAAVVTDATGQLTAVDLGETTANDALDGVVSVTSDISGPFAPGQYTLTWTATDAAGNSSSATQSVKVLPLVSLVSKVRSAESKVINLQVVLNGDAPDYPVIIPYTLSGTALIADGDYTISGDSAGQQLTIEAGRTGSVEITVLDDGVADEGVETIEVTLAAVSSNGEAALTNAALGTNLVSVISIVDTAVAPSLSIDISQAGAAGRYISIEGGEVNVTVNIQDPNGNHAIDWSSSDNNLVALGDSQTAATLVFNPVDMLAGSYKAEVIVSDDQITDRTFTLAVVMIIKAGEVEADSDGDGIPDSKDASDEPNVLSLDADSGAAAISAEPGVKLVIGNAAAAKGVAGAQITEADIASGGEDGGDAPSNGNDEDFDFPLGLLDFVIQGLSEPGVSVKIVIPLQTALPANATYRKYTEATGWLAFESDTNNGVFSAAGTAGACPEVGATDYTEGLTEGHFCIQLQLEDGGANDADGEANGSIDDPGGIATQTPVAPVAAAPAPVLNTKSYGGCSVGTGSLFDPMLPLMLLLAGWAIVRRRYRRTAAPVAARS